MYQQINTRRGFLKLAAATAAVAGTTQAQTRTLRFVATGAFAPFNMMGDGGEIVGVYADLLREIGKLAGFTLDYKPFPWVRAQRMVEAGEADGYVTRPTKDRERYALFTKEPLVTTKAPVVVILKSSAHIARFTSAESFDNIKELRVGDYRGNSFGESFHKDWSNRQVVNDMPSVLRIIEAGRVDYTVQVQEVAQFFAKQLGLSDKLAFVPLKFLVNEDSDYHIAIRSSLPDAQKLIADIEAAQAKLRADGTIQKVIDQYV